MITKGCLYHIIQVWDVDAEPLTFQSRCVSKQASWYFIEREIDFSIDMPPGTQRKSILSYKIALTELKVRLKDMPDKGLVLPHRVCQYYL